MAHGKRKVSAQTRVKLSQAAKKRRRGLKGTSLGGKFMAAMSYSGLPRGDAKGVHIDTEGNLGDPNPSYTRITGTQIRSDSERMLHQSPSRLVREHSYYKTVQATGKFNHNTGRMELDPGDIEHAPVTSTVRSSALREVETARKEKGWKKEPVYATGQRKAPQQFITQDMAPGHRAELDKLLKDPNSNFNAGATPGETTHGRLTSRQRNRLRLYTEQLQEGKSHEQAYDYLSQERRGRKATGTRLSERPTGRRTTPAASRTMRKGKYESTQPRPNEIKFGVSAGAVDKASDLRKRFPDASDTQIVQFQQTQRETIFDDFQKNTKWAHETRRANILGQSNTKNVQEGTDRVVFFTTNLGGPAPSVPADSAIGQYIIGKRKDMMKNAGVNRRDLRGEFPAAVRDMHIFEMSTGLSYGVEGRHGTYKETGWRYRNKAHGGINKPTPVGSQIMYDSSGVPIYDKEGNTVFNEGATRPFKYNTPNVGLRLFIG